MSYINDSIPVPCFPKSIVLISVIKNARSFLRRLSFTVIDYGGMDIKLVFQFNLDLIITRCSQRYLCIYVSVLSSIREPQQAELN